MSIGGGPSMRAQNVEAARQQSEARRGRQRANEGAAEQQQAGERSLSRRARRRGRALLEFASSTLGG